MKRALATVAVLVVGGCLLLAVPVLMFLVSLGSSSHNDGGCGTGSSTDMDLRPVSGTRTDELDGRQLANASAIVAEGNRMGVSTRGILIALAVAHQESGFRNYANDGKGEDLAWYQRDVDRSLGLPHGGVGSDHGSLGVFQQQWPWWGSMDELMDPPTAARKFYRVLLTIPGWKQMPVTEAGQAVQKSAYPDAYADDVPLARALLQDPATAEAAAVSRDSLELDDADCVAARVAPGTVTYPLPHGSGYADAQNFGAAGAAWSHGHTGTDLSVGCGTPVLAATAGTVVVRTDQPWSGRWLVQVTTGVGRLTTWYGHMRALDVTDGQHVQPGEQIGQVGSEGNSSGCHLHFEIHPRGGTIYQDGINPSAWLRGNVGRDLDNHERNTDRTGVFTLATFNVLGHSHTAQGGNKPGWASSRHRMRNTVRLLDQHHIDVIGLQEIQRPQARAFRAFAGGTYQLHSPRGDTENSVAWRSARWDLVGADTVAIPYFNGHIRHMPVVRLRDRTSNEDSIFISVHNPANTSRFPRQESHRAEAVRREAELVRKLRQRYGIPVYLVGDLNDRRHAFCALTDDGLMTASAGGSNIDTCQPPTRAGIDWILASSETTLTGHSTVSSPLVRSASDHPLVMTIVHPGIERGGG